MSVLTDLPPLTGSSILDPWRIRLRLELAGQLLPPERKQQPTLSERMLWELLEHEPPGWRREYSTGLYRLDFYCPALRLAVEVDGGSHYGREAFERDADRDNWHRLRGIRTKRFSAREVEGDPTWVLGEIRRLTEVKAPVPTEASAQAGAPGQGAAAAALPEAVLPRVAEELALGTGALVATLRQASPQDAWGDAGGAEDCIAQACRTVLPAAQQRAVRQLLALLDI